MKEIQFLNLIWAFRGALDRRLGSTYGPVAVAGNRCDNNLFTFKVKHGIRAVTILMTSLIRNDRTFLQQPKISIHTATCIFTCGTQALYQWLVPHPNVNFTFFFIYVCHYLLSVHLFKKWLLPFYRIVNLRIF